MRRLRVPAVARLLVGQKMGTFRVALRGTKDDTAVVMRPLLGADLMPASAKPAGGVEYIVGGKTNGAAALAPMLVHSGLPPGALAPLSTQAPQAGVPNPDVKTSVEQVLRQLTAPPPRRLGEPGRERPIP